MNFHRTASTKVAPAELYYGCQHYLKPSGFFIMIAGSFTVSSALQVAGMQYLPSWLGGGQRKAKFLLEHCDAKAYRQIMRWMESGEVKMVVEKRFQLEQKREALVELQKGRTRRKIVVEVAGE